MFANQNQIKSQWIILRRNSDSIKLRLFCFPYAGGSSIIFQSWESLFSDLIEVCPVNLPGRSGRIREKPISDMESLTKATTDGLIPFLDIPFVFMGHSMGGTLAFEVARNLRYLGLPMPMKLIISGCGAPQTPFYETPTYNLPDDDLIDELRRLNGTPTEVLDNKELLSILLPIIRSDFSVCQNYIYKEAPPLDIPVSVLRGIDDEDVPEHSVLAWKEQTTKEFNSFVLPGDHFFCNSEKNNVIKIISKEIESFINISGY